MSANNNNQEESDSNSNTSTMMSLTGKTINSVGLHKRDIDKISRIVSDDSLGTNNENKRRKLSDAITASHNHPFQHVHVPQEQRKRSLSPTVSSPPVLKPCNYLMKLFQTKDLPTTSTTTSTSRIDSFSIEE